MGRVIDTAVLRGDEAYIQRWIDADAKGATVPPEPATTSDLMAEVYRSLLDGKEKQAVWAAQRLNEVENQLGGAKRILAMLCDANSEDERARAFAHARDFLDLYGEGRD